jgi:hypothetical protein
VEAKARGIIGITGEEKDVTAEEKQRLDEARAEAKADLTTERQDERMPRIMDFEASEKVAEEDFENCFSHMLLLGALMPLLLFARNMAIEMRILEYDHITCVQIRDRKEVKTELREAGKNCGQRQDQLASDIMCLEQNLAKLNQSIARANKAETSLFAMFGDKNKLSQSDRQQTTESKSMSL